MSLDQFLESVREDLKVRAASVQACESNKLLLARWLVAVGALPTLPGDFGVNNAGPHQVKDGPVVHAGLAERAFREAFERFTEAVSAIPKDELAPNPAHRARLAEFGLKASVFLHELGRLNTRLGKLAHPVGEREFQVCMLEFLAHLVELPGPIGQAADNLQNSHAPHLSAELIRLSMLHTDAERSKRLFELGCFIALEGNK